MWGLGFGVCFEGLEFVVMCLGCMVSCCVFGCHDLGFRPSNFRFRAFISQKVFLKSFCKNQFPHKSVNLSFSITNVENKLTDLCGN